MNEKEQVTQAQSLKSLQELMQGAEYKERLALIAKASFDKYTALRRAGFDAGQALFLTSQSPF